MNGKLSRKWARISIVCIGIFLACCLATFLTNRAAFWLGGTPFMIAALIIKYVCLRCPGCGRGGAVPQWSKSGTYHCPLCGIKLEYDDQKGERPL